MAFSFACAGAVYTWTRPSFAFLAATMVATNACSAVRHWCEHIGSDPSRESNSFRFPLGMGIGNHDAHHRHPGNSWLTMALALWRRPKETGPLRTLAGMLLDPTYRRYGARH